MSKKDVEGKPIDNLLYTKESKESAEKAKAELSIPDPSHEKALGVLQGQEKSKDESSTN